MIGQLERAASSVAGGAEASQGSAGVMGGLVLTGFGGLLTLESA